MPQVHRRRHIEAAVAALDLLPHIEAGFVAYSEGRAIVPPVGELIFQDPPGDAHIKYGYIADDDEFVIKVATGFYDNPKRNLPGNSGLMLVFSATTGFLQTVLLDEGYLTNVRTAIAGAISVKWLARSQVDRLAVFGTGLQARMQVEALRPILSCRRLTVWGRRSDALAAYQIEM
jgi:ornithine cyclodeaminase